MDARAQGSTPASTLPGCGQRLLVVDEQPEQVGLAIEMLLALGFEPEGYIDAGVALQALREQPGRYAGVVTAEAMSGLTGTQFTRRLRGYALQLPVLLLSDDCGTLLARHAAEAGVSRVLARPLQRAELSQALNDCLR